MTTQTEALKLARQLLWRYRHETPIGNQPHMICQEADEAFKHIDEALEQPEQPTCFADWQDTHATDRGCGNCHLRTECRTGQPEQEPENRCVRELREFAKSNQGAYIFPSWDGHRVLKYLGDTTPPQRTWVGLTDEEKQEWIDAMPYDPQPRHCMILVNVIEAKLKEKNNVAW